MRTRNHGIYRHLLREIPGLYHQFDPVFDGSDEDCTHVHWMNAIRIKPEEFGCDRDSLMAFLKADGIDSRKLFTGMHRQKSLLDYGCDASDTYPVTDDLAANGLYLPSSSTLDGPTIARVCESVRKAGQTGHR
jgi:perosamine synthetase